MYYAAMRPAEVIHLQKWQCRLPADGVGSSQEATLTLDEHALVLAKRPYDLRHAAIWFWLA
jgi:hypothetical protein